jgi:hypothetical protein
VRGSAGEGKPALLDPAGSIGLVVAERIRLGAAEHGAAIPGLAHLPLQPLVRGQSVNPMLPPAHPMTSNTVRARLTFSFRAEVHDLDSRIDLDRCAAGAGESPDFHLLLARQAGIDPYSYLYEVLESHDIEFSEATGLATPCCRDGRFDWPEFERLRQEEQDMEVVREIAERMLGVGDLDARADLKAALLAAYRAGKTAV